MKKLLNKINALISLGKTTTDTKEGNIQTAQIETGEDEILEDVQILGRFGFASAIPAGSTGDSTPTGTSFPTSTKSSTS